jgi:hypothetical protein
MAPRTYPDSTRLKASIQDLLERRYGEEGEHIPKLGLPDDDIVERRLLELIEFYKTPFPNSKGESPQYNVWYVMAPSGYAKDSRELDNLLHDSIPKAKRPATKISRENKALELISTIFDEGWQREPFTGKIKWAKPFIAPVKTPEQIAADKAQARAIADAMWRRGSRDS